jgi:putative hemolysin
MEVFNKLFYPLAGFFASISQWILKYVFNVRMDDRKGRSPVLIWIISCSRHGIPKKTQRPEQNLFEAALALPKVKVGNAWSPEKRSKASI